MKNLLRIFLCGLQYQINTIDTFILVSESAQFERYDFNLIKRES